MNGLITSAIYTGILSCGSRLSKTVEYPLKIFLDSIIVNSILDTDYQSMGFFRVVSLQGGYPFFSAYIVHLGSAAYFGFSSDPQAVASLRSLAPYLCAFLSITHRPIASCD